MNPHITSTHRLLPYTYSSEMSFADELKALALTAPRERDIEDVLNEGEFDRDFINLGCCLLHTGLKTCCFRRFC